MTLPFTTNTVTIEEADDSGDKWESRSYTVAATGVPCVISLNDTNDTTGNTQRADTEATLFLNPSQAITSGARVTDESDGTVYLVAWVAERSGLGLERREAGMRHVVGV